MTTIGRTLIVGVLAAASLGACGTATGTPKLDLQTLDTVELPGTTSRFDYQSLDPAADALWIAHLGDSTVVRVDLVSGTPVASVPDIAAVHGVVAVAARGRTYATATGTDEVVAIDPATNTIVARAPTGAFPDGIAYDPDHDLILVSNKNDGSITIHDPTTLATLRTVALGDETGNVSFNPGDGLAYTPVQTPDTLAGFDPTTGSIAATVDLDGCDGAHGLAIDSEQQLAYVACENNATLAVVDLASATLTDTQPTSQGPDVIVVDPQRHRLWIACESGNLDLYDTTTSPPTLAGSAHLDDDAHTVAVDHRTGYAYLPIADDKGTPALRTIEIP